MGRAVASNKTFNFNGTSRDTYIADQMYFGAHPPEIAAELAKLTGLRKQIDEASDLPAEVREAASEQLGQAIEVAKAEPDEKKKLKDHLDAAAEALKSAGGVVAAAASLGTAVAGIAAKVVGVL